MCNSVAISFAVLCLLSGLAAADQSAELVEGVRLLSREMLGLMNAYLEAVPECPPRADTPIRLWQLDMAWLRALSAFDEILPRLEIPDDTVVIDDWNRYLISAEALLDHYQVVMNTYHRQIPTDSAALILERELIRLDSEFVAAEHDLYVSIAEEEPR